MKGVSAAMAVDCAVVATTVDLATAFLNERFYLVRTKK